MQRILILSFLLLLLGCQKEELASSYPLIQTGEVTDISAKGAKFHAFIINQGAHEITEWGFVWSDALHPTLANAEQVGFKETPPPGPVSFMITTMLVVNRPYYVRAYVKDKLNVTYGSAVRFLSLGSGAPELLDFYPKVANKTDTITIIGKNFSIKKEFNQVAFGEKHGTEVVYATTDTIKAIVPDYIEEESTELSVSLVGNKATFSEKFSLHAPKITRLSSEHIDLGDTLRVTGQYFTAAWQQPAKTIVRIGSRIAEVLFCSADSLAIKIPANFTNMGMETAPELSLSIQNHNQLTVQAEEDLSLLAPEITDFYPRNGNLKDTLTIVGKNLSKLNKPATPTLLKIDGINASIIEQSPNQLKVLVPENVHNNPAKISIRNQNFLEYEYEATFQLLIPEISSISPGTGNLLDTLTISGKNLASTNPAGFKPVVTIGGIAAPLIHSLPAELKVLIPSLLNTEHSTIEVLNQNKLKPGMEEKFSLNSPVINGISPAEGKLGSAITISGTNFMANPASLEVLIGNQPAVIQEISETELKVEVPSSIETSLNTVAVKMNNILREAADKFTVTPVEIYDFEPKVIKTGQEITITGDNFHLQPEKNRVRIGGFLASVTQASLTELKAIVPLQETLPRPYLSRNVSLSVEVLDESKTFSEEILIDDNWFRITDYPEWSSNGYYNYQAFVTNNIVSIGLKNGARQLWSFDLSSKQWKQQVSVPSYNSNTGFVVNNSIFLGSSSDWFKFYPSMINSPAWYERKTTIGEEGSTLSNGFSFQNNGYLVVENPEEYTHKIWTYNHIQNTWQFVTDFPEVPGGYILNFTQANDQELFLGLREANDAFRSKMLIYAYSFATDSWRKLADYPADGGTMASIKFIHNNQLYLKTSYALNFWRYEESTNSWAEEPATLTPPATTEGSTSFQVDNKLYIGLGRSSAIWEYDPNR